MPCKVRDLVGEPRGNRVSGWVRPGEGLTSGCIEIVEGKGDVESVTTSQDATERRSRPSEPVHPRGRTRVAAAVDK